MIENNVNSVRKIIEETCSKVNRKVEEITLIAVSKQNPFEQIVEANSCGIKNFGENKAKELKQKAEDSELEINWHFIGHLQTNKVKDVVPFASLIHSVDTIKLAEEINKRAGNINKVQKILLEVNTSGEASKFGVTKMAELHNIAKHCKSLENISLVGLMTMAPFTSNENIVRNSFNSLKNIFGKLNSSGFELTELSMGMTNDYQTAIEEGATILRIGTAIFS
jgi:pyridoxal phosphate enzyme (YggS family)